MVENEVYLLDLQAGRESGLRYFIRLHGKSLRFFAYTLIRRKEVAEEIVSDTFVKLWHRRERFVTAEKVKAFLFIATRNACYDHLDSPRSRSYDDVDMMGQLQHPQPDLLAKLIENELVELVYHEINNLPPQQSAVLRMSFIEGMTTQEIGNELGISSNAVFLARSRALARLRVVFQDKHLCWCLFLLLVSGLYQ